MTKRSGRLGRPLLAILAYVSVCFAQVSNADESAVIDPSDMTNTYTTVSAAISSQANIILTGTLGGAWNEKHRYLAMFEGFFGDRNNENSWGTEFLNYRAQYFHVIETGWDKLPNVGFSIDYMEERENGDNLTALGTLALLPSSLTGNWLIYPSAAYVEGDVSGASVDGYMLIVYGSRTIGDDGAYIWVWPEYLDLGGAGVDTDSLTLTGQYAKPLNADRSMWLNLKLEYGRSRTDLDFHPDRLTEDESVFTVGLDYYF